MAHVAWRAPLSQRAASTLPTDKKLLLKLARLPDMFIIMEMLALFDLGGAKQSGPPY